jgi:hypothetical protein
MRLTLSILLLCCASTFGQSMINPYRFGSSLPQPDNALILWWKLNEGSGTSIADSSGNGYNATLTEGTWITGKSGSGGAIEFDGVNDYAATTGSVTYGANVITVCAWVWEVSAPADEFVYSSPGATFPFFGRFASGVIQKGDLYSDNTYATGRIETSGTGATGAWFHWAIVYDNTTSNGDIKIYHDGTLVGTSVTLNTKSGTGNFAASTFYVGQFGTGAFFANFKIDDLRIYSGELDATEVGYVKEDPQ